MWLLSEKKGIWGVFYKAAVIGTRLHMPVALSCVFMAFYVMFLKWWGLQPVVHLNWEGVTWTVPKWNARNAIQHLWEWFKRQDENVVCCTGGCQCYTFNNEHTLQTWMPFFPHWILFIWIFLNANTAFCSGKQLARICASGSQALFRIQKIFLVKFWCQYQVCSQTMTNSSKKTDHYKCFSDLILVLRVIIDIVSQSNTTLWKLKQWQSPEHMPHCA